MSPSILVAGSVTVDHIGGAARLGGVVTYAGATFARLGCQVAAAFRAPLRLPWISERLRALGIEPQQQDAPHVTRFVHAPSARGERSLRVPETAPAIGLPPQALEWMRSAHLHLGPLHPDDLDPAWLESPAAVVSLDMQGYVRRIHESGRVLTEVSPLASPAMRAASFVKTSEHELAALLEGMHCDADTLLERHGVTELAVTRGAQGGYVLTAARERIEYGPESVAGEADATGAGDVFFAAWLVERVHKGTSSAEACRRAARLAARQVSGHWLGSGELGVESEVRDYGLSAL